ncbi:MAG TPA: HAMP domain-containing sensor histidine kinase [Candidatus Nitrosocosmicus sp.]|nr:HAMP domain-containing sensor histidine kinase [Candidatus Nitrosocosmicus sp.]
MNPSFHPHANGEPSEDTNLEMLLENLNQSNQQLLQTIEILKAENSKLQLFINIAAHELRTPIMPIVGYAEILQEEIGERKEIKGIIYNAKRLDQLAGNILEGAKIENQTLQLRKEQFNLKDILTDIIDDYDNLLAVKGRKDLKLLYEPKDILLVADKVRVGRVISNLLNNAIKFTAKGKITLNAEDIEQNELNNMETKLEQKNEQQSGEIQVSIKDTGTGLSPTILPKLFSKFVSTDSGGTGLGLFVSKNIVEAHGGKIQAQNNDDGKGAMFSFIIPKAATS